MKCGQEPGFEASHLSSISQAYFVFNTEWRTWAKKSERDCAYTTIISVAGVRETLCHSFLYHFWHFGEYRFGEYRR